MAPPRPFTPCPLTHTSRKTLRGDSLLLFLTLQCLRLHHTAPPHHRKNPRGDFIQIDTTNILFVCGGAFIDLDRQVGLHARPHACGGRVGVG